MTFRRMFLLLASIALGFVLIVLLIKVGKIDLRLTLLQLESVTPLAFVKLVLLNGLLIYLSTEKWRSIDAAQRLPSDSVPSRITSFAVTSAGMALGLIVPMQIGMAAARTLGTYVHGRPLQRGTAGTLLEQSFDLLIVVFLAVASGVTWYYQRRCADVDGFCRCHDRAGHTSGGSRDCPGQRAGRLLQGEPCSAPQPNCAESPGTSAFRSLERRPGATTGNALCHPLWRRRSNGGPDRGNGPCEHSALAHGSRRAFCRHRYHHRGDAGRNRLERIDFRNCPQAFWNPIGSRGPMESGQSIPGDSLLFYGRGLRRHCAGSQENRGLQFAGCNH